MNDKCDSCGFELPGERPENVIRRRCAECYIREASKYDDKEIEKLQNRTPGGRLVTPRLRIG